MNTHYVTDCYWLNLRSEPNADATSSIIAALPSGQLCDILDASGRWWHVQTVLDNVQVQGYVSSRYLSDRITLHGEMSGIVPVHLSKNNTAVTPQTDGYRAHPIGTSDRVVRDTNTVDSRVTSIHRILDYLDVEASIRY